MFHKRDIYIRLVCCKVTTIIRNGKTFLPKIFIQSNNYIYRHYLHFVTMY